MDRTTAVQFLQGKLVLLLDAWDSYLHTAFYLEQGSLINQIKVSAYQAGHSMAALSWDTSLKREKLEPQKESGQPHVDPQILYQKAWQETFTRSSLTQAQSQITMLSKALDDAYVQQASEKSAEDTPAPVTDPQRPGVMLTAISESLEYWLRAIEWFDHGNRARFTSEYEEHLYTALLQQANIWQSLMLGQQTLQMIANQSVTHEILNDFMKNVEDTIGQDIAHSFAWVVRTVKRTFFAGLPLLLLVALWLLLVIFLGQSLPLPVFYKNLLTSILSALGVVGGFFASQAQKIKVEATSQWLPTRLARQVPRFLPPINPLINMYRMNLLA